jgi:uncharacterized membrane protein YkvA (DUF1232 family)
MAIEAIGDWVERLGEDAEAMKELVQAGEAALEARVYASAALSYLVARMDLVPDWEEGAGLLDDALALRVYADLATSAGIDGLDADATIAIGRLSNESERLAALLGDELAGQFRDHCERLAEREVRGRVPESAVEDLETRAELFRDVRIALEKAEGARVADAEAAQVKLVSYLKHKLG